MTFVVKTRRPDGSLRSYAELLPDLRAANAAWRQRYGPRLAEQERIRAERREHVRVLLSRALVAVGASESDRADVFIVTGMKL